MRAKSGDLLPLNGALSLRAPNIGPIASRLAAHFPPETQRIVLLSGAVFFVFPKLGDVFFRAMLNFHSNAPL
jgi:hypothetical protein